MQHTCDYCGSQINEDLAARFYPEDDTLLCERCFPLTSGEGEQPHAPAEGSPRAALQPVHVADEA